MKKAIEIRKALKSGIKMIWNDPQPIEGNDYTVDNIFGLNEIIKNNDYEDYDSWEIPVLIHYGGGSEAEVYLSEIEVIY